MAGHQGSIIAAWTENGHACLAVRVDEPGGAVEYIGRVPEAEVEGLSAAQRKAVLAAAVKAERDAQVAARAELGISGTVTL